MAWRASSLKDQACSCQVVAPLEVVRRSSQMEQAPTEESELAHAGARAHTGNYKPLVVP